MNDKAWLEKRFNEYRRCLEFDDTAALMIQFKEMILDARDKCKTMYFAGNGASTTIASHAALDFTNQLAIRCHAMNDPNFITCFSNDFGYEDFMERTVKLYADKEDMVVLISSSGRSQNAVNAAIRAKLMGCKVVTFTGFDKNNPLKKLGDINFWLNNRDYNVVESTHMTWLVTVCDLIASYEKDKIGTHGRNLSCAPANAE